MVSGLVLQRNKSKDIMFSCSKLPLVSLSKSVNTELCKEEKHLVEVQMQEISLRDLLYYATV